jgi:hypothetical protein
MHNKKSEEQCYLVIRMKPPPRSEGSHSGWTYCFYSA